MNAKTINLLFFTLFNIITCYSSSPIANELEFSRVASDLEQKILIKSDVIEAVRTGVSQLQKACDLETNKLNLDQVRSHGFVDLANQYEN